MKNKSKLKKMKQKSKTGNPGIMAEWLYMNTDEISFCQVKNAFSKDSCVSVQIWEEAGVCELEIKDSKSIDLEISELDLQDDYANEYLKEHEIKTLFLVTISPDEFAKTQKVMEQMTEKLGGFFCGDTEDFTPVIKNN